MSVNGEYLVMIHFLLPADRQSRLKRKEKRKFEGVGE